MYEIRFYRNRRGEEPVKEYLEQLKQRSGKDARLNYEKITDYLRLLRQYGTIPGKPVIDYLGNGIWELRPLRNRILFIVWHNNCFILLHHFIKATQKTPKSEIEKAKREYAEIKERGDIYE